MSKLFLATLMCLCVACKSSPKKVTSHPNTRKVKRSASYKWTKEDEALFIGGCIGTAKTQVGQGKAESYCECMLSQLELRFVNMDSAMANPMDTKELKQMVELCRR